MRGGDWHRLVARWQDPGVPHRWLPRLMAVGALFLSGCAGPAHEPADPSTGSTPRARVEVARRQGHEARYIGPVDQRYRFAGPGITLTAPAPYRSVDVSWRVAFDACFTGPLPCVTVGDAVVSLARVTGPGDAGTAPFGGRHRMEQALTYVVAWDATDCSTLLPTQTHGAGGCRLVDLVTAEKIRGLDAGSHVYAFVVPASAPVPHLP